MFALRNDTSIQAKEITVSYNGHEISVPMPQGALCGKGWSLGSTYSTQSVPEANAIIYFPPGEYILYDKETDSIDG